MITAPFNNMPTHYMAAVNHSYHNNQQTLKKKKKIATDCINHDPLTPKIKRMFP